KLLQQIGEGGMGVVFLAEQSRPVQRKVALKIIKPGMDTRQVIARFAAEQQALALMDHPNIARVFDAGTTESGRPYFVMELVKGVPITDYCDQHRLTPQQRLELFIPICHALQHAHQKGIIHRDLKPSNVLVALYDGRPVPKVIDFGVAKATGPKLTGRTMFTEIGQVVGTLEYMSPEQAELNQLDVDTRSDIYSLGVLLYELLTGTTPFERKRLKPAAFLDLLRVIREEEPPKPSTRLSTTEALPSIAANRSLEPKKLSGMLRGDLDWIVMKALEKDRSRRYETADALSRDLQRFLADEPVEASPPSTVRRARRLIRRNKRTVAAAVAVVVIAVVSTTAALAYRSQLSRAETAEEAEKDAKHDALAKLWDSYVVAARAGRMSRRPGQRFDSLRAIEKALSLPVPPGRSKDELRTEAIAAMLLPDLEVAKELPGLPRGTTAVAIDQAFQRYARGDAEGNISVRRVTDDVELFQFPGVGPLAYSDGLAFSPDGRFLMQGCETAEGVRRRVWKLDGSRTVVVLNCHATYAFSPNSRQFAASDPDGSILLYDLETGKELNRFRLAGFDPTALDWNPCRPMLAARELWADYRLLDLTTGKFESAMPVPGGISSMNWHPGGRLLAVGGEYDPQPTITLWDTLTRKLAMPPLEAHEPKGIVVRFNHAGDRLLSTDWTGLWRLWDARTGQLLLTQPAGGAELCFSPDDSLVGLDATTEGLRMYRFRSGGEFCTVVHRVKSIAAGYMVDLDTGCHLDRSGRLLAIPARDGVAVVDVVRGEEITVLPLGDNLPIDTELSGALLTHGSAGVLRWPVKFDAATGTRVYGPPQTLAATMSQLPGGVGCSTDGKVLAFAVANAGARELLLPAAHEFQLEPQEDVRQCAVSPNGRWVATGSHFALNGSGAKIWDAQTGRNVRDLPVAELCFVSFSPDGKWLLTTGGGARLWSVGTWDEGPKLGSSASRGVFSADGKLLALQDVPGVVRLVVPDSGTEVARLTALESIRLVPLCFTVNGKRLICGTDENEALYILDLGQIRTELAAMGLDWGAPSIPVRDYATADPLTVRIVGTERLIGLPLGRRVTTGAKSDWSPDAAKLVVTKRESGATQDTGLEILDLASGASHKLVNRGNDPAWSPAADGLIAFVRGSDPTQEAVFVVRSDGTQERKIGVGGYPQWSADGKTLYFQVRSTMSIMAVSPRDEHAEPQLFFNPEESFYPAVSPDGHMVAYISNSRGLIVVKRPGGELVKNWPLGDAIPYGLVAWHPDGKRLAYCDFGIRSGVWMADLQSGKTRQVVGGKAWKPAWSADGKHLLYVMGDSVYVVDSDKLPAR
ncbi:MAG TPA: protein kinase, partial [Pirellulales bacterium]|nr:protein kinase [Pirellulales bacterium]